MIFTEYLNSISFQ